MILTHTNPLLYIIAEVFQLQKESEAKNVQLSNKIDTEDLARKSLFIYR